MENFHAGKTVYKETIEGTTKPQDYHIQHVQKGRHTAFDFGNSQPLKAYDTTQARKMENLQNIDEQPGSESRTNASEMAKRTLLKSGVEHWRSNYQAMASDPRSHSLARFRDTNGINRASGNFDQSQLQKSSAT